MKIEHIKWTTLAVAAIAAATCFTGCSTTAGYQRADKTGAGIAEFRAEVIKAKQAVDETVTALGQVAVTADTNPRAAFQQFSKSLANLETASAKAQKRGAEMKAQGQAYFAEWEKQMAQLQNPEIRELATKQKTKLQATFESMPLVVRQTRRS